ncbi:hypothetical protein B296_00018003 [Ensete ventricosum]|uniref:BRX domain-containing protein n=1 Tax=Ensete ventricosum TaxID=4639 RepID=A0A426Z818_ENSVE|nr:hypothetical protein B296_00018003 [Ensete ventricosum]
MSSVGCDRRLSFVNELEIPCDLKLLMMENHDKVMELYNVQRFNRQAMPLPTPPRSEDERLPSNFQRPLIGGGGGGMGYSSSDSLEQHPSYRAHGHHHLRHYYDSVGLTSTPKLSSISGAKTETSSMDASVRTSSSPEEADHSGELSASVSNASDLEREWVEEDEPGVYITIRELPGGIRELRRVRFRKPFHFMWTVVISFHVLTLFNAIIILQSGEVWRDARKVVVGGEPHQDTGAISLISKQTH